MQKFNSPHCGRCGKRGRRHPQKGADLRTGAFKKNTVTQCRPASYDGIGGQPGGARHGAASGGIAGSAENRLSYELVASLYRNNVGKMRSPVHGGQWAGEPGNSRFIPDDDAMFHTGKGCYCVGSALKQRYRFSSIAYHHSEPDFMPFADPQIGVISLNGRPTDRYASYSAAQNACVKSGTFASLAEVNAYMQKNGLVWHECGDGMTMIAVPRAINQAFPHTGGIGANRGLRKIGLALRRRGRCVLVRKTTQGIFRPASSQRR